MDSGIVGAIENGGLVSGDKKTNPEVKVYTRRSKLKKAQSQISNYKSATAPDPAGDDHTTPPPPAAGVDPPLKKDYVATNGSPPRPPSGETLGAKDGNFSKEKLNLEPSRSGGEPSTSNGGVQEPGDGVAAAVSSGVRETEDGIAATAVSGGVREPEDGVAAVSGGVDGGEASPPLPNGGEGPRPHRGPQEDRELSKDGKNSGPSGGEGTQEAVSPLSNGGQEQVVQIGDPDKGGHVAAPVDEGARANGVVPMVARVEDRVRISITESRPKDEMRKLKRKLEQELGQVKNVSEKLHAKEVQLNTYSTANVNTNSRYVVASTVGNHGSGYSQSPQLVRANSELGAVGSNLYSRPQLARASSDVRSGALGYQPFRHLSVAVGENNQGVVEYVEKEKRTPKANQFYRNSEFLLGKDRLPPESNKKLKLNCGGRKHGEYGYGYQNRDKVFRSCSSLLQRLMKHKHGWVFNEPVDAKKLNLPDYHIIIKHPMDLGTIKARLAQNWYKSAREFAEDVRLVFHNAMTYNPKGQDVHIMAEELLNIFEEKWMGIEKDFYPYQMYYDAGLPIPTPRKAPPPPVFPLVPAPLRVPIPASSLRSLDRSESMAMHVDSRLKPSNSSVPHVARTPAPKKPKAKDPNKRDMTYEEKQKLSSNLQSLPHEKLDAIVQIIKKRSTALSQHDDEIEVDIDSVDAETLWELDRFVTNYKKSLSKNKRKAELALQRREAALATQSTNPQPTVMEVPTESRIGEKRPIDVEKQGDNVSGSSGSSSSSSDSGSSSSDSDSDSSSASGSDAGQSPKS